MSNRENTPKPLIIRNPVILGIYQLAGGIWGLALIAWTFRDVILNDFIAIAFLLLTLLLFGFSVFCGILCIKKEKRAFHLSRINQCLQLVWIAGQKISVLYVAGVAVYLGLNLEFGFGFTFNYSLTGIRLTFSDHSEGKIVAINLIALFFLFNFNMLIKEKKQEQEKMLDI